MLGRVFAAAGRRSPAIEFVASGTFAPRIFVDTAAYPGAEAEWIGPDGAITSGVEPSIVLEQTSAVRLRVRPWAALQTIILRHDGGDGGESTGVLDSLFPIHDAESCRNIYAVRNLHLVRDSLLGIALSGTLIQELDLHGFSALRRVESFYSTALTSLRAAESAAMERFCVEANPIAGWRGDGLLDTRAWTSIRDIRGADCDFTHVLFPSGTLEQNWHICVRNQRLPLTEFPTPADLPAMTQFWISGNSYSGTYDLSDFGEGHPDVSVWLYDTLGLTGITPGYAVTNLEATNNPGMDQDAVDALLSGFVSHGRTGGSVIITGTAIPSAAGLADVATLQSRGWTVSVDS